MAKATGTLGQLWLRSILPPDIYHGQPLDKKTLAEILSKVAQQYPDKYKDITFQLNQLGRHSAYFTGGNSFGLRHLRKANVAKKNRELLQQKIDQLMDDDVLDDKTRRDSIIKAMQETLATERKDIFKESDDENNPLATQLKGAGRGNEFNLAALRGSDGLYEDHRGRTLPVPVMRSYSEGLTPMEYLASTFGARKGIIETKFSVADAGFFGKQLVQAAHRLRVEANDRDTPSETLLGLPVDIDDENVGAVLAQDVADYAKNTVLTPKIIQHLKGKGVKRLLVRSPISSGSPNGGVYARDVGVREFGRLPTVGEMVGITGGQAVGEPLSQGMLGGKHSGGVAGASKTQSLYDVVNQMIQVPSVIKGGGTHARVDGTITRIDPAPAGGTYVYVDNERHFVAPGFNPAYKKGDTVEAGDMISDGLPNPAIVVQHKGVGEGRRYFLSKFREALKMGNVKTDRRNVELLARGLIDHVRLTSEMGDFVPDDVVKYSVLEHNYKPRPGFQTVAPNKALGKYLERPYLHYSIGTKIRPSMLKDFDEFKISSVDVHDDEPPFEPEMVRAMTNLRYDQDWMTRQFGSYLKDGLLEATHRGSTSDQLGTSFVPSLAKGVNFVSAQPKPDLASTPNPGNSSVLKPPRSSILK
jgi:hypothetical protein